jgi:hypothetical protein
MTQTLIESFERMGARVNVEVSKSLETFGSTWNRRLRRRMAVPIRLDIKRDDEGHEYFDLRHRSDVHVEVLDVQSRDPHLLVEATESNGERGRFLCGHDERSWFVAAIPEGEAPTVQGAKDALKPDAVWDAMREHRVPLHLRDLRRTKAFIRQGEWFFIPRPRAEIDYKRVRRNEPISRGGGKPHRCQFLFSDGGVRVHVCEKYPNGLTEREFGELSNAERHRHDWERRIRDARVYVRGAIQHPDHDTIWLKTWHQVEMNTESKAKAMKNVAFLD